MNTILASLAMWALVQVLIVWLGIRLVGIRELDLEDYLELEDYAARRAATVDAPPHRMGCQHQGLRGEQVWRWSP
jgi:hypothetical protein